MSIDQCEVKTADTIYDEICTRNQFVLELVRTQQYAIYQNTWFRNICNMIV